jgi:hypothetical protein
MKLPNFKRIYDQDYKDEFKDFVRQLSFPLNVGIEVLYEALNKKLTFRDNISCSVKDIKVIVDSSGNPTNKTIFGLDSQGAIVDGCNIIKITNDKNPSKYPIGGVFLSFIQTNEGVLVQNITGLTAGESYTIRIIAYHQ